MIKAEIIYNESSDVFNIWKQVFGQNQNNINEQEVICYVIVYEDTFPVATGQLIIEDHEYKIEKIAVLKEKRRSKYGDLVVRMLIDKVFNLNNINEVYACSTIEAIEFFKSIGFKLFETNIHDKDIMKLYINKNMMIKGCKR